MAPHTNIAKLNTCCMHLIMETLVSAYYLKTKRAGPRVLLVAFNSYALKTAVIRTRRLKQILSFKEKNIYINDQLTTVNNDLAVKARQLLKNHSAYSTWVHDGQIFIKWSRNNHPMRVNCAADLSD